MLGRFEGSWVQALGSRLKALHLVDWTTLFGAALLLALVPLIILLGGLANQRIDDDLSRHIGLNSRGAHIVEGLFRTSPTHAAFPIITGLLMGFAGTVAVVASLQVVYERAFDQEPRGWRDVPRYIVWVVVLFGALIAEAVIGKPVHRAAGPVIQGLLGFLEVMLFFWWTMHFLLAGRMSWRALTRPAFATAILWIGLSLLSSVYFSSAVVEDSQLYGTIGVIFTVLTWFIAIGMVIVLGAACGSVWQQRQTRPVSSTTDDAPNGPR